MALRSALGELERDRRLATAKGVEFLGSEILRGKIRIGTKARHRLKDRVGELTRRNNGLSMTQIIRDLAEYLRGSEANLGQDGHVAIGGTPAGAICPQSGLVLSSWPPLPRRFHATESQTGVGGLTEARHTWPARAVPSGGGRLLPASYRDVSGLTSLLQHFPGVATGGVGYCFSGQ